jgi:uncharacterized membrane protein
MRIKVKESQGAVAAAAATAALAAGGTLLLSKQLRERRPTVPLRAISAVGEQITRKPGRFGTVAALVIGGLVLSQQIRKARGSGTASSVKESIEVDVPLSIAYNQWTQFEDFPKFMDGVQDVRQIDDTHLHWCATVAGKTKEWDAEITEQIPDDRIAWRSTSGARNSGVVTFHRLSPSRTKVTLQMEFQPDSTGEAIGGALGGVKLMARDNLKRFRDLIEGRGVESGAWRKTMTQH